MVVEFSLNPNCSEAVIRFGTYARTVDTAGSDDLEAFAKEIEEEVKSWKEGETGEKEAKTNYLYAYDNIGGGANFDTLARICYAVIEKVYEGKEFEVEKVWDNEKGKAVKIHDGAEGW